MPPSIESPALETRTELWKKRAQGKQKWLEQALAEPTKTPGQAARRMAWIKRALQVVKRAQSSVAYQTRLVDAYAQHLNALEMTLMSQVEQQPQQPAAKSTESERRKQPGMKT